MERPCGERREVGTCEGTTWLDRDGLAVAAQIWDMAIRRGAREAEKFVHRSLLYPPLRTATTRNGTPAPLKPRVVGLLVSEPEQVCSRKPYSEPSRAESPGRSPVYAVRPEGFRSDVHGVKLTP